MTDRIARLAAIRERFLARLAEDRAALAALCGEPGPAGREQAIGIAHKLAGLAGSLGFPTISIKASCLEATLLGDNGPDWPNSPEYAELLAQIETALASG